MQARGWAGCELYHNTALYRETVGWEGGCVTIQLLYRDKAKRGRWALAGRALGTQAWGAVGAQACRAARQGAQAAGR